MKIRKENYKKIIEYYSSGQTLELIANKFGVSLQCIHYILRKNNILLRSNKDYRDYHLEANFFENIDSHKKAAILGFICADGHNNLAKGTVQICLNKKDIDYLLKINDAIQPDKKDPIVFENRKGYPDDDIRGKMARLSIYCQKMCNDLLNLGVTQQKSLTLKFPNIESKLLSSFVAGYFDGDGGITFSTRRGKRDYTINFVVSDFFGEKLKNIIVNNLPINCHLRKQGKISIVIISGNNQVEKILDWMYSKSPIILNRKYNTYLDMKNYLNKYGRQKRNITLHN